MFQPRFPIDRIADWSARYPYDDGDARLLSEVGPAVRRRGYLLAAEFRDICYWKSPRSQSPTASTLLHFCDRRPYPILDRALWQYAKARQR